MAKSLPNGKAHGDLALAAPGPGEAETPKELCHFILLGEEVGETKASKTYLSGTMTKITLNVDSQVAVQNNSLKSRLFTKIRIWLPLLLVMIFLRSRTRSNFKGSFQVWRVVKGWSRLLGRDCN